MKKKNIRVLDLGLLSYPTVHVMQREFLLEKKRGTLSEDIVIFVEHPPVYTMGRKGQKEVTQVQQDQFLNGVPLYIVERGGDMTFHNEGQLVCYPIFRLSLVEKENIAWFIQSLEEIIIRLLTFFNIQGESGFAKKKTGVWIKGEERKIASIGVAFSQWISYHGLAINITNTLDGFFAIEPCGFSPSLMTSVQRELSMQGGKKMPYSMAETKKICEEIFREVF